MRDLINFSTRIAIFAALSALILAGVFSIAQPLIQESKQAAIQNALEKVLPQANDFKKIASESDQSYYYKGLNDKNSTIGYILPAQGKGYSSIIEILVAINKQKKILGLKIISQQETPGLGTRIMEIKKGEEAPWFQKQFINKSLKDIKLKKDGGQIVAITGATISSKAVVNAIHNGLSSYKISK